MAGRSLSELVQQAEQLSCHMDEGIEELPRVDRSLTQILHSAQNIFSPSAKTQTGTNDAQASILLGSRGLDLMRMSNQLEALKASKTLEPLVPVADTDVETFLDNERYNAIISAIEDTRRQTNAEVEHLFWEQQKSEWEQAKQKFMSEFSNINADTLNITQIPQESLSKTMSLNQSSCGVMSREEMIYAKVVLEYNATVLRGGLAPNLTKKLANSMQSIDDENIKDLWTLLLSICEVPRTINVDRNNKSKLDAALVKQSKLHLEKSYERHMQTLVFSHLEKAKLGGIPGLVPLVRAYLSVVLPPKSLAHLEDGEAQGVPVWPLIFYCLRAGGAKAAATAIQENSNPFVVEMAQALEDLGRSENAMKLPHEMEKKLKLSYKRTSKSITDPFKRIVYCVLCKCDVNDDHTDIIVTTDDYLWLKLSLVDSHGSGKSIADSHGKAVGTSSSGLGSKSKNPDCLTLSALQNLLYVQYGEKHFNAWQQPLLYLSVLLLTAQFEAGIEFLNRIDALKCHAVHIALALFDNDLLSLPTNNNGPLLSSEESDAPGRKRLNLVKLIRGYINKFETGNYNEALNYCYFLRSLKSADCENMFLECVCDMVLETREFDVFLGQVNLDGSRTIGQIDKFKIDPVDICEKVARDSEKKGLHEDAIKLFDLANNHEKAIVLLNKLLSQVVHSRGVAGQGSKRGRLIEMATAMALRYKTHGHNATAPTIATLHLLLDLTTFFDLYHQEKSSEAIEVLNRLRIIALSREEVEPRIKSLSTLGLEVKTVIPHVLLAAMNCTYRLYQTPSNQSNLSTQSFLGQTQDQTNLSILNTSGQISAATKHLKGQALAIVTFAGMLPLRLNADVNATLVQLEALIN